MTFGINKSNHFSLKYPTVIHPKQLRTYFSALAKIVFIVLIPLGIAACSQPKKPLHLPKTNLKEAALLPKPLKTVATFSAFALDQFTSIHTPTDGQLDDIAHFLSEKIELKTGLRIPVNAAAEGLAQRIIYINQADSLKALDKEAYQLYINKDSIILNAATSEAAFRGVQTLRQLIPEQSNDTLNEHAIWPVPTGKIVDHPNFAHRGTMLDVARHFFSVKEVKKYIDALAYYKINVLHLHLTDDQGWRIEIKAWPKLTEIGGQTEVGGGKGGFYSQEDYKDLVAYASKHYITIIPEVDMPGHTNAASLSYPILHAGGKAEKPRIRTDMKVGYSSLHTEKDTVYRFIDDVVREISALSPGPYFHIGGDESHVTKKKDYINFVERVATIVEKHGKRMVGWADIAAAGIDSTTVAQFWRSTENAEKSIGKGAKLILSPAKKAYLDMKYDTLSKHGLDWAGLIPVDTAYLWNPETYSGIPKEHILGIEAPLWSETIATLSELEYLAFPRIIGYAELGWSTPENRSWEEYKERLARQTPYLERMGINYYPSPLIQWVQKE